MKRVLVIDDDVEINTLLAKVLTRAGYQVHTALTGEAGLSLLSPLPGSTAHAPRAARASGSPSWTGSRACTAAR